MCFAVEIDRKQFPDISRFTTNLDKAEVLYMSNEYALSSSSEDGLCRFEFDDNDIEKVSGFLAELVKNDHLRRYASYIIETNYCNMTVEDKSFVMQDILQCVDTYILSTLILDFIKENKHIHLGGFSLFRMKKYLEDFEDEIDFAVDEYMQQKRYREFVGFLKFFVDVQEPAIDKVNLVIERNGDYRILDADGVPVSNDILDSTYCEISTLEENDEYIMINDLISLAPNSITIHCRCSFDESDAIKIISEIFEGRVAVCHCCKICSR